MSRLAVSVLADGGVRSDAGRLSVARFDRSLRDDRHSANPGTTADLTAAAIFVAAARRRLGRRLSLGSSS